MLNKISRMLKQQEGFTLMELMIVVVIIGILAGIAVPLYNGIQERSKKGVGQGNADMLNRAVEQLVYLDSLDPPNERVFNTGTGANAGYIHKDHFGLLVEFIGYGKYDDPSKPDKEKVGEKVAVNKDAELRYVKHDGDMFVVDTSHENLLSVDHDKIDNTANAPSGGGGTGPTKR